MIKMTSPNIFGECGFFILLISALLHVMSCYGGVFVSHSSATASSVPPYSKRELPIGYVIGSKEFTAEQQRQILRALKLWSAAAGRQLFRALTHPHRKDEVQLAFSMALPRDSAAYRTPHRVLAWTLTRLQQSSELLFSVPQQVYAHIFFNPHYFSHRLRHGIQPLSRARFAHALLHELGHVLGLAHVSVVEDAHSVMHPHAARRSLCRPSPGDIQRLRDLYSGGS